MVIESSRLMQVVVKPFNPFIILSSFNQALLFFTQTFAQISGFHPSTIPSYIPFPVHDKLNLEIQHCELIGNIQIYQFKEENSFYYRNSCVEALIHELRTASLAIDLGAHIMAENEDLAPMVLNKLLRAAHRQKVSTLVASDFIQLVTIPPLIYPTSLIKILSDGLSHSPALSRNKFCLESSIETFTLGHVNPVILGNFHYLTKFFSTLLIWLEAEPVTVELEIINPISVQVSLNVPHNHFLSNNQGFSLIPHYVDYFAANFNARAWVTQTSINILFPLVLSDLKNLESFHELSVS